MLVAQTGEIGRMAESENDAAEKRESLRARRRRVRRKAFFSALRKNLGPFYFLAVAAASVAAAVGILALHEPAAAAVSLVLLEDAIVFCLQDVPVWLHLLVVAVQASAGLASGHAPLAFVCAALYLVGIFSLRLARGGRRGEG